MTADGIERGYLRLRLAAALTLIVGAVLASHLVTHAQTHHIERRIETADALDAALAAVTEQLVALGAIGDVSAAWLAADERAGLSRLVPTLETAAARIREGIAENAVSAEARAILEDPLLDPLALLEEFAAIARAVAERPELWGEAAAPHVAVAHSATMQLLPVIRRVRTLEAADLERATARLEGVQRVGLALIFALAIAIWALIFAPMERRVTAAQAAAREGRRAAEAAFEAKSAFVATMSHEIRTPLTAVLGLADLLAEARLPPGEAEMARTVASSGRALLAVVNDVLDFSKLEAGRLAVEARPLDAEALARELGRLFGPQAAARGVALRVAVEGAPAPRHLGCETPLRQVLANLLGNAVKFTEAGEIVLRLAAEPPEAGRQALRFEVRDTGVGIAPEALGRVFEAFEQAEAGTARRHGGTGLGLAIARRLALAMGGRLEAESAPGRGSCFRLDLALPVAPSEADAPAIAEVEPPAPAPAGGGPLVLVVDDNAVNRRIASGLLERAGARVAQAEDGAAAVEAALRDGPDLVLMDISMPGMDGLEATRRIRAAEAAMGRRTPVLALSAHVGEAHRARCLEAGMDGVLGKPFRREEIEAALARHARARPEAEDRPSGDPPRDDPPEEDPAPGDPAMIPSPSGAARPRSGPGLAAALAALALSLAASLAPGLARAEDAPGALAVLNWVDYIAPSALDGFTAETGIALRYHTYLDAEATEARLASGGSGYDLAVVSSQYLGRLVEMGALAPFDLAALPGRARLRPDFLARLAEIDVGGRFAVPYLWSATGVGYDAAAVAARMPDAPVDSWRMVFDPEVVARFADCGVGFVDMPEEVVAAALAYLGRDPNSSEPADLAAAIETIAAVAPYVSRWDAEASETLATGELCLALTWSGDVAWARQDARPGIDVAYALPREGAPLALDVLVLPADAARPEAAHRFVEHLLRPEVIARTTDEMLYANANAEALALVDPAVRADPAVYPPEAAMERLFLVRSRAPAEKAALARAWRRLRLGL